ncbi:hypothetical protein QR680_008751 [Steinernema hermaphroditum]|uniref:Nucleolar protein 6 n=1 Tax=Steinernema hermaphroditum TaxID=289476 RepID=A0AA39IHS9_9BILA|nr:hypothetical protein QR680_008751 [Steinernema hermaphroditum]
MKRKAGKRAGGVPKKKKLKTADVIAEFNKSPFVLQCDDVLADNCFSTQVVEGTDQFVNSIIKLLKNAKLKGKYPLVDTKWMEASGVVFPLKIDQKLVERMKSSVLEFEFKKPQNVEVVGDWNVGAVLKSVDPEVLLDVEVPTEYFGQRDHLNFIYHVKRAHYASACAVILRKSLKNANISFVADTDKPRNADLLIERIQDVESGTVLPNVRITFSVSPQAPFAVLSRLLPTKNCLRSNFIEGKKNSSEEEDKPTPCYNKSIVSDICRRSCLSKLVDFLSRNEAILKAYKLLKLWASRSGLLKRSDGLSAASLAAFLMLLDQKQIISDRMELPTVLSYVWKWFAETSFSEPLSLNEEVDVSSFEEDSTFVFLDFDGNVNLTSSLSTLALGRIKREASRALRMLPSLDSFHHIFVTSLPFSLLYDQYITVTLPAHYLQQLKSAEKYSADILDHSDNWLRFFITHFVPTITKGWEDRIPYFDVNSQNFSSRKQWPLDALHTNGKTPFNITIGMELQNNWNNPITRGPVANTPEGADFRKFWGKRSELRKFADNTICEAVVWAENGSTTIPVIVLRHLLERHFALTESALLDSVVPEKMLADPAHFERLNNAYDQLSKHLRNAKDLPLGVANINPISAALRRTDPYPPLSNMTPLVTEMDDSNSFALPEILKDVSPLLPTVHVKITLEKSGRWADDIDAISKLKAAFYIEVGRCLAEQFSLKCYPQRNCLYIIMERSTVFSLEIVCPKEVTILRKIAGKKDGIPKDSTASRQLEKESVYRPQLCSSLTGISNQFSSFGETCQIVRQWIASQYLLNQFDPVVIELLVANVYLSPVGFAAPLTPYKGFVHFLNLLVDHNWLMKPLFVDFTKTWTDTDIHDLSQNFLKMRAVLPPMVIITPDDSIGSRFTRGLPQPVVLKRIIALASSALKVIIATGSGANLESLFASGTGAYDLLISVNPKNIAPRLNSRPKKPQNNKSTGKVLPVVDFNPVELFVSELKASFDSVAYFFYNHFNPDKIGVIWKPVNSVKEVNITNCVHQIVSNGKVAVNREAIIEDIRVMAEPVDEPTDCGDSSASPSSADVPWIALLVDGVMESSIFSRISKIGNFCGVRFASFTDPVLYVSSSTDYVFRSWHFYGALSVTNIIFYCSCCNAHPKKEEGAQVHQRLHTNEKPFACSHCGRRFPDRSNWRVHEKTHSREKTFVCGECGKAFAQKNYLTKHEKRSHGKGVRRDEAGATEDSHAERGANGSS